MSDHIFELLGAYLDGELGGGKLQGVETHLRECQICQEEYSSLQALSTVLQEAPRPDFSSVEQLVANVALRLPRKPAISQPRKALNVGWWLFPVGLITTWIFISTTFLVSNMLTAANAFGLLNSTAVWLISGSSGGVNYSAILGRFGFLEQANLGWLASSESFARNLFSNIFLQVSIAVFYLSWLAVWWARHTRQGHGQPLES